MTESIRKAAEADLVRIAEILVFNYRLNFYPIFKNDEFYFSELTVPQTAEKLKPFVSEIWVYDDGAVKGFAHVKDGEVKKLFVEPVLHNSGTGSKLIEFAKENCGAKFLWALEKNEKAIRFYNRHGFYLTDERKPEEDTAEFLVKMKL